VFPMIALFPVFLVLGLFLPGFFLAKYFRHPLWWASAFTSSLVILFHCVFWLGISGAPLTLWTVAAVLIAVSAAAAWLARGSGPLARPDWKDFAARDRILLVTSALVGVVLLVRVAISPMIGYDTSYRWDFLAQRILALGRFDFYPPLDPADFKAYFYVDGIPPMVSFT